jgi:hypothetical protein
MTYKSSCYALGGADDLQAMTKDEGLSELIWRLSNILTLKAMNHTKSLSSLIYRRNPVNVWLFLLFRLRRLEALLRSWTQYIRGRDQWRRGAQLKAEPWLVEHRDVKVALRGNGLIDKEIPEYWENALSVGTVLEILLEWAVALRYDEMIAIWSAGVWYNWDIVC